jgi:hypothetical protein
MAVKARHGGQEPSKPHSPVTHGTDSGIPVYSKDSKLKVLSQKYLPSRWRR